jgi:kinetochore protein Nuf2
VTKTKDRNVWQKKKDHLAAEQARLEAEIEDYISTHEAELNELLEEYATIRQQAGESQRESSMKSMHSLMMV